MDRRLTSICDDVVDVWGVARLWATLALDHIHVPYPTPKPPYNSPTAPQGVPPIGRVACSVINLSLALEACLAKPLGEVATGEQSPPRGVSRRWGRDIDGGAATRHGPAMAAARIFASMGS